MEILNFQQLVGLNRNKEILAYNQTQSTEDHSLQILNKEMGMMNTMKIINKIQIIQILII